MSTKPKILIQFDPDDHPSLFDAVVGIDSDVDHLLQYGRVEPKQIRDLVHGAIFTRGPKDLHSTAIFIGGSVVEKGEALFQQVKEVFFGPMRVSVMLDSNGANSTAAAAILSVQQHLPLAGRRLLVLAATGPVGQRVCRLALQAGALVVAQSRSQEKADRLVEAMTAKLKIDAAMMTAVGSDRFPSLDEPLRQADAVVACGAAGIALLRPEQLNSATRLQVAVDLNAVPPLGLPGIEAMDKAVQRGQRFDYGALGVGGLKMKIHKAAIRELFSRNDQLLDAEEMVTIGRSLV